MILLALTLATAPIATHAIEVAHHGRSVPVTYSGTVALKTRTIGAATPNRTDMQRCLWSAQLVVERAPQGLPELARAVSRDTALEGNRPGACPQNRPAIEREVAGAGERLGALLVAAAERDRPVLAAELAAGQRLAIN